MGLLNKRLHMEMNANANMNMNEWMNGRTSVCLAWSKLLLKLFSERKHDLNSANCLSFSWASSARERKRERERERDRERMRQQSKSSRLLSLINNFLSPSMRCEASSRVQRFCATSFTFAFFLFSFSLSLSHTLFFCLCAESENVATKITEQKPNLARF